MKKFGLLLQMALLGLLFASCTVETSKVTVTVTDLKDNPIANRKVFYTDMASNIIGAIIVDPNAPFKTEEEAAKDAELSYGSTNAQGTVTFKFDLGVKKLTYYFYVLDEGSNQWSSKAIEVKRGSDYDDIVFKVNK